MASTLEGRVGADINLPKTGGLELLAPVVRQARPLTVIRLAANDTEEMSHHAAENLGACRKCPVPYYSEFLS